MSITKANQTKTSAPNCTENIAREMITTLAPRELRENQSYVKVYIYWMNLFVNLLIPLAIMFILNLAVYKEMKKLWA